MVYVVKKIVVGLKKTWKTKLAQIHDVHPCHLL